MPSSFIMPVDALVSDARTYLRDIADPAVQSSISDPANPQKALAAFILLYHVKDWSKSEGVTENDYWTDCPFAQLMSEIANGSKHQEVTNRRLTSAPVVLEFRLCGFNQGGYGIGPFGRANIQVSHRLQTGDTQWSSLATVLNAVLGWWMGKLQPLP